MISVKSGTQTWSSARQESAQKPDGTSNISSADKEKYFNDESLGETLNKVADPNHIDESKKMRTTGNNQLGKDAFMTLLLTQMKNQDPTNPLKSHEMAAQLAQFTQLEKLNNIDSGIAGLRKDGQPNTNFQALAFIGKTITTDTSKVSRADTESVHDVRFNLAADAQQMKMQVKDAAGNVVRSLDFKNMKAGKNELQWNGMTDEGVKAPPGDYSVSFEAVGSNGRKMFVETKTEGVISGVNFTPKGPQLMVGKSVVNMSDVKSISDNSIGEAAMMPQMPQMPMMPGMPNGPQAVPANNSANTMPQMPMPGAPPQPGMPMAGGFPGMPQTAPHQGPKNAQVKPEAKGNDAKRARLSKGDLNDAAMSQGFINNLNKAGAKAGM